MGLVLACTASLTSGNLYERLILATHILVVVKRDVPCSDFAIFHDMDASGERQEVT